MQRQHQRESKGGKDVKTCKNGQIESGKIVFDTRKSCKYRSAKRLWIKDYEHRCFKNNLLETVFFGNFLPCFVNNLQNLSIRNGKRMSSLFLCLRSLKVPYLIALGLLMCDIVMYICLNDLLCNIFYFLLCMFWNL